MSPLALKPDLAYHVRRAIYQKMAGDTGTAAWRGLAYHEGESDGLLGSSVATDLTHSIYYAYAPDGAEYPYVIFHKQSGTPVYTFKTGPAVGDGHAIADNELWLIKGVAHDTEAHPSAMDAADKIASRIDALFTDGALALPTITATTEAVTQLYLRRETDIAFSEEEDGETYFHHGALYRLMYSAT